MSAIADDVELIIPDQLAAELERAKGPVALRTQSGRKLGQYTPEPAAVVPLCPWEPDLTNEEIERRMRESKGRTWAEIRKRLEEMRPL